jgi:hypothetical protein
VIDVGGVAETIGARRPLSVATIREFAQPRNVVATCPWKACFLFLWSWSPGNQSVCSGILSRCRCSGDAPDGRRGDLVMVHPWSRKGGKYPLPLSSPSTQIRSVHRHRVKTAPLTKSYCVCSRGSALRCTFAVNTHTMGSDGRLCLRL